MSWTDASDYIRVHRRQYDKPQIIRQYNFEKDLIVGCGSPNPILNGYSVYSVHDHTGQYTINYDILYNPCLIAMFGIDDLTPFLHPQSFHRIIFESMNVSHKDNICTFKTLIYLLIDGGKVIFTRGFDINTTYLTAIKHNDILISNNGISFKNETEYNQWMANEIDDDDDY